MLGIKNNITESFYVFVLIMIRKLSIDLKALKKLVVRKYIACEM